MKLSEYYNIIRNKVMIKKVQGKVYLSDISLMCGFDPHHRHKKEALQLVWGAFFLSAACERVEQHDPAQQGSNQPCGLLLSARETLTTDIKAHQAFAQCR